MILSDPQTVTRIVTTGVCSLMHSRQLQRLYEVTEYENKTAGRRLPPVGHGDGMLGPPWKPALRASGRAGPELTRGGRPVAVDRPTGIRRDSERSAPPRAVRSNRSGFSPSKQCLVKLDLRSWSPGFSRSFPPKGGTPTHQSTVDSPLAASHQLFEPGRFVQGFQVGVVDGLGGGKASPNRSGEQIDCVREQPRVLGLLG